MTATPVRIPMDAEEFLASEASAGYELVDGVPEEIPMGAESSWIGGEVHRRIANLCVETRAGTAFPQETGIAIWPERREHFRKPDVAFFRRGRLGKLPAGLIRVVPDLIVEVVSPGDEAEKLETKIREYRAAGVPLVWVIYPESRTAYVYRSGQPVQDIGPEGRLDGTDLIPGLMIELAALFDAAESANS